MKHLTLCAALLLCGNVHAATYVYQANAYQSHDGCGRALLPFQMTITVRRPFPPNSNLNVPFQSIAVNAGGNYQWGYRNTKKHELGGLFTTDSNGDIIEWTVGGAKARFVQAATHNESNSVEDVIEFKCGSAGNQNRPGTWTRTN
jgi:hypothetical protein